ncbi:DUF1289 domain-containing protein [Shewanella loihica]|uniref:DUF1289 domain-containing protein n=1 Tax=Shewanella loihica (strain ATCC BAA-1088 / PV-4) TaxID=323850 RepID=A3QDM9_SHELP|nr:DUF1289 domain-containing protein [Shewanella loihica]ABO23577.1 protein of unknown function DUF1289 [Shewanella loihica PV-4]
MQSPCVARCGLNEEDICMGCFRHIDEIVGWGQADEARQAEIWDNVNRRKQQGKSGENQQIISRQKWLEAEQRLAAQDADNE